MNPVRLACVLFLSVVGALFGGTFTTQNTFIPVAASADGTASGDTISNTTDQIHLDARVYIPDGVVAPAPALIVVHGYGGSKDDSKVITLATDFASAGYVVLTPTVRGFGKSDGQVALVGPDEVNDLKTILLAMQTGSIGESPAVAIPVNASSKLGVLGASYGGGHSFEILRTQVAGLAAVMPIIGWSDLYQALAPNNVPKLTYTLGLFAGGFDTTNPNYASQMFDWVGDLLGGTPEKVRQGDPQHDIDWRSVIFNSDELSVPTFVVQGWKDYLFPANEAISLFQSTNAIPFFKLYIGGLGHPPASLNIDGDEGLYLRAQALRWFDQWLKGIDTGILDEPAVTVAPEDTKNWSTNALVFADTFPLPGTTTNTYFVNGKTLSTAGPAGKTKKIPPTLTGLAALQPIEDTLGGNAADVAAAIFAVNAILNSGAAGILDPKIFTESDDGANKITFTSAPLVSDLNVVGVPSVQLTVSAKTSSAYYFVLIEEKLPSGETKLVTRGAFKDPTVVTKTPHPVVFDLFAVNHRFQAGSQIKLRIASRDYPFFLPNLNQPTIKIYTDPLHPASLSLPVSPQ